MQAAVQVVAGGADGGGDVEGTSSWVGQGRAKGAAARAITCAAVGAMQHGRIRRQQASSSEWLVSTGGLAQD